MEENKDYDVQNALKIEKNGFKTFFHDLFAGIFIGIAFIIPGFSGGSVAAILGIYEKLIEAIAGVFRHMKESIITLLPIGIGLVIGTVSLLYPLGFALSRFPLPVVSLFVGLAIGGVPSVAEDIKGRLTGLNYISLLLPALLAAALCFIPTGSDVNLYSLELDGYVRLFFVGVLGSSALVIPGISGSMMLLILGYYNPIIKMITEHLFLGRDFRICVFVLGTCAAGIGIGFLIISIIMKHLLIKCRKGTYLAIVGFIVGSLPAVYVSTMKDAGMLTSNMKIVEIPHSPIHWIACVLLLAVGIALSYGFTLYNRKKTNIK